MAENEPQSPLPLEYRRPGIKLINRRFSMLELCVVLGITAAMVSVSIVILQRAERLSPRVQCLMNLHQVGLAIGLYTQQHQGSFPDTFATLVQTTRGMSPAVLICPDSTDTAATGATTQALQASLQQPSHSSYIYLGKGMTTKSALLHVVIAYEAHSNHGGGGINALFGDGHVESLDAVKTANLLAKVAATSRPVTIP
jgi:prepilin-type processing-associated H-X9-DG protein